MKSQSAMTPPPEETLIVKVKDFKADPVKINKEHKTNALVGGLTTSAIVAGIGLLTRHKVFGNKPVSGMTVGAVSVGAGLAVGAFCSSLKTSEEKRSEALTTAARSGHFVTAVKEEMNKLEKEQYWNGFFTGLIINI